MGHAQQHKEVMSLALNESTEGAAQQESVI